LIDTNKTTEKVDIEMGLENYWDTRLSSIQIRHGFLLSQLLSVLNYKIDFSRYIGFAICGQADSSIGGDLVMEAPG